MFLHSARQGAAQYCWETTGQTEFSLQMPWPFLIDLLKREILSHTATMISLEDVLTDKQVVKRQMCDPTDMTQACQRMGRGAWVCGVRWLEVVTQHGNDSFTCWKKKPWELLQTSLKTFNTKNWMVRRCDIGRILCYCFLSHLGEKKNKDHYFCPWKVYSLSPRVFLASTL